MNSRLATIPVLGDPAPSPTTWLRRPVLGRQADRDLPSHLRRELNGIAAMLHDVKFSGAPHPLDHIVVAPSGAWLIDTVHFGGRISRRDVIDNPAFTDSIDTLVEARRAIAALQLGIEVQTAICLIDTTWPMTACPFKAYEHWVTWPRALTDKIRSSGLVPIRTAYDIADAIADCQNAHLVNTM